MMFVLIASLVFCLLCFALTRLPTGLPLSRKVLAGLLLGALFGLALQLGWGADDADVQQTLDWVNIVGGGYVSLLKVVMMPLVFTSILSAINKLEQAQSLGKISAVLIGSMLTLLPVIALGSIGVAGVGGGGTFAALIVLSTLNFPIALVGVMIAIEPLVDMGRTALNVNGSIMAAMITKRLLGKQQLAQAEQPQPLEQAAS
ncbi:cation:dicarboxylate symporter family transporter [Aeromonas veronii]|uniref:cation:dicarboxylate symporter family transporter n=1 Tax=Aeromonas veronii TaxID=654 RepID=UPI00403D816F